MPIPTIPLFRIGYIPPIGMVRREDDMVRCVGSEIRQAHGSDYRFVIETPRYLYFFAESRGQAASLSAMHVRGSLSFELHELVFEEF